MLLRKSVYPCEYMDNWKRFDEILLPLKKHFYSNLDMEDIANADYKHAKNVWKNFKIKNLGEYHDLYVPSYTLLLADVFEKIQNIWTWSCTFFISTWISMTSMFKKTEEE